MIEEYEVVNLAMSLLLFGVLLRIYYTSGRAFSILWVVGIAIVIIGNIFTVAEGFYFPVIFNLIEHICYPLAALLFLTATVKLTKTNKL